MIVATLGELQAKVGESLGTSGWHTISQYVINAFARVTGDDQWVHVEPRRASIGPFGTTIAHGNLTCPSTAELIARVRAYWEVVKRLRESARRSGGVRGSAVVADLGDRGVEAIRRAAPTGGALGGEAGELRLDGQQRAVKIAEAYVATAQRARERCWLRRSRSPLDRLNDAGCRGGLRAALVCVLGFLAWSDIPTLRARGR